MKKPFLKYSVLTLGIVAALTVFSADAEARQRSHSGTYSAGKYSGNWTSNYSHKKGEGFTRNQTATGQGGKTWNRSVAGSYDRDTKTYNQSTTGWGGKTYTSASQYDYKTKAFNSTVTNEQGKALTLNGTAQQGQRAGTWTGSNGKTGTYNQNLSYGQGVFSKDSTVTGANGKSYSWDTDYSYNKETRTLTGTSTGPAGKTHTGSLTFND
ncbi:MAG: hypothetical protein ACAH80_17495 [Alphaproteobacteria bacterium]